MQISSISKDQAIKILKTALYIAVSGALSALIAYATDNKDALGVLWPIINLMLVSLKQLFTTPKA